MADPTYLDDYVLKRYKTVARTINEQGNIEIVGEDQLADWLADNPDMRPPGTGEGGEWTLADEKAAVDLYDEGKDYGDDRPVYDILADQAEITGPQTGVLDEPATEGGWSPSEYDDEVIRSLTETYGHDPAALERAIGSYREMQGLMGATNEGSAGVMDPQVSEGLTELLPTPEMFGRFRQEAAKEAIGQSATKRPSESEYRTYEGFGEWKPTQKWYDEQHTGPLTDEQRLPIGRGGVADASDEALKRKNQKSLDNPYGGD